MSVRIAAQVVLAQGADAVAARRAQRAFGALGFAIGALVGGNFSIEAEASVFLAVFGVRVSARSDGSVSVGDCEGTGGSLPLERLPSTLRPLVAHVLFTAPPAFGPGAAP